MYLYYNKYINFRDWRFGNIIFVMYYRKFHKIRFCYYPFIMALGILGAECGFVVFMKFGRFLGLICGIGYIILVFTLWIKDASYADISGEYTIRDYRSFRQGFRLFLLRELVLFITLLWGFLDSSVLPIYWLGRDWASSGLSGRINYLALNIVARRFLMSNSFALVVCRRLLVNNSVLCEFIMIFCILVGVGFLCFQYYEYGELRLSIADRAYGRLFFLATGVHGSHVLVGVCFLFVIFFRLKRGHLNWLHKQSLDICIEYWMFLELIWGLIFRVFYIWGS